jgi:hypothetical protein
VSCDTFFRGSDSRAAKPAAIRITSEVVKTGRLEDRFIGLSVCGSRSQAKDHSDRTSLENPPCTEAQAQSQVEQSRPTPPRADAPPFNPKQEEQLDYAGEDDPCNRKTPIWLPSARVMVDTVTGLQFLFLAYPDGRLHPAQDVTHHHRGYHTRPSTMPAHGRTAL